MPDKSQSYLDPYHRSFERHGAEFDVTLWASPQSQAKRFRVFTEMYDFTGKRLLDAGCSRGDFAAYLVAANIQFKQYVGVDGLAEVIDFAKTRDLPRCEFVFGDFLTDPAILHTGRPDVICISGSLNTMSDAQAFAVLSSAWAATGSCLLFNFLSSRCAPEAPPQTDYSRRLDTMALFDWALTKTSDVQFRQDYFRAGHDATIAMRKTK